MRQSLILSTGFIILLGSGTALTAKADPPDRQVLAALFTALRQADRLGDFERADEIARKCITLTSGMQASAGATPDDYYCRYYLSSALRKGRGVPRNEARAFALLSDLVAKDPDGDAALDLTEEYLDGLGPSRDPVEAGVTFWRIKHGAWSVYSNYWGMCDECRTFLNHEKVVGERIERELTADERKQAEAIAVNRFPEIAVRVRHRDRQIKGLRTIEAVLIGGLLWLSSRWYRRLSRRAA